MFEPKYPHTKKDNQLQYAGVAQGALLSPILCYTHPILVLCVYHKINVKKENKIFLLAMPNS